MTTNTTRSSLDRRKLQPSPLQTGVAPAADGLPSSQSPATPSSDQAERPSKAGYQRFVLTDPVAFRYLEEDPSTTVLDRRRELTGYECYLVEQWTTSRSHPTFMITTYSGDPSHKVIVAVLSVPTDETVWSPRLRVYFKALNQYHARRRDTPLGILMVTNLSGFPSSLTVVPVPDGDVRKHRFDFFVNEDLKRLGCSGRVGLSLSHPTAAAVAKFHQLYHTSEKNDIYRSVVELIKLCQSALMLFDKLEIDYADGLLCDVTERAINDWWSDIGGEYYSIEPHDGILGPTTVAGLLGLLMGARNRLHAVNAPVSKEAFDVESMKRAIGTFQKQQRMPRTRRLDRRTLDRLHKATQKAADKERWAVPKAVKSTVAELSGKSGEMVMDAVGRRDRAGIAEIETVDMDRFVQLLYGDQAKWLWLGKPVKKTKTGDSHEKPSDELQREPHLNKGLVFKSDEHGGFTWASGRKSTVDGMPAGKRDQEHESISRITTAEDDDSSEEGKLSMFKRASTLKDDAKSGLGKVRGAVGLRSHKSKPSSDETTGKSPVEQHSGNRRRPLLGRAHSSPMSSPNNPIEKGHGISQMPAVAEQSDRLNSALGRSRASTSESQDPLGRYINPDQHFSQDDTNPSQTATATASIAGSIYNGIELSEVTSGGPETGSEFGNLLRRTISYNQYVHLKLESRVDEANPRHLSFSLAEESVLRWQKLTDEQLDPSYYVSRAQFANQELLADEAKRLRHLISALHSETSAWTTSQLNTLKTVLEQFERDQDTLDSTNEPLLQDVRELQTHSEGITRAEKERLGEGVKEVETLAAKLDYEVDTLKSKVEDVEVSVGDFATGVARVEDRVGELERAGEGGVRCAVQ